MILNRTDTFSNLVRNNMNINEYEQLSNITLGHNFK